VEHRGAGRWIDIAARALRDPQQQDYFALELRRSRVEGRDHLEVRLRWLDVARRYERVLLEAPTKGGAIQVGSRHALWTGASASTGSRAGCGAPPDSRVVRSRTPRLIARTRRPTCGKALPLPYGY